MTTFLARNRSLSGVRTHQTGRLLAADRTERAGIPVTCAARTAVDLGAVLTPYLLASFVDHLGRSGHLTIPVLANELEALGGRGRRGTRALQRIVADRREGLEAGDSDLEVRIVRTLVLLGVAAPVQGHQVTSGRRVFVLDLAWPDALVAVEVDGFAFHASRTAFDHDRERDLLLRQVGWEVIRVSSRTDLRMLARLLLQRGLVCEGPHTTPKWTRQASRVNGRGRGR